MEHSHAVEQVRPTQVLHPVRIGAKIVHVLHRMSLLRGIFFCQFQRQSAPRSGAGVQSVLRNRCTSRCTDQRRGPLSWLMVGHPPKEGEAFPDLPG